MTFAERDLGQLLSQLREEGDFPARFLEIGIRYDEEAEEMRRQNPRFFCFTEPDNLNIFCASGLNRLPLVFRLGVLLHEIGHVATENFIGDLAEVRTDVWCVKKDPEYRYENCGKIPFLQRTGDEFAKRVQARRKRR